MVLMMGLNKASLEHIQVLSHWRPVLHLCRVFRLQWCAVQYSVFSVKYAVCNVQCALCSVQCAVCNVQCSVCII